MVNNLDNLYCDIQNKYKLNEDEYRKTKYIFNDLNLKDLKEMKKLITAEKFLHIRLIDQCSKEISEIDNLLKKNVVMNGKENHQPINMIGGKQHAYIVE